MMLWEKNSLAFCVGLSLALTSPVFCWADGGFFPPHDYRGSHLREPAQRAVLIHGNGRQTTLLWVDYVGDATDFAWVVPCPGKPAVREGDKAVFVEAVDFYYRAQVAEWKRNLARAEGAGGAGGPTAPKVTVHSSRDVGPYRIAVLSATDGAGLQAWLRDNGYAAPKKIEPILQQYVDEKWWFAAVKVRSGSQTTLRPLRFDFRSPKPVYPLRISAVGEGVARVIAYLAQPIRETPNAIRYADSRLDFREFEKQCPKLVAMRDDLDWSTMHLRQFDFTLPPQVMRLHDDASIRPGDYAMAAGIAEAWVSPKADESNWARANLLFYSYLRHDEPGFGPQQAERLRNVGAQLGEDLFAKIRTEIKRGNGAGCRMAAIFDDRSEATITALTRAGAQAETANDALNALLYIGTPQARSALLTLARSKTGHPPSAWNRYTSSLAAGLGMDRASLKVHGALAQLKKRPDFDASKFNIPPPKTPLRHKALSARERKRAPTILVELLARHRDAARGDTGEMARHLLVYLTEQDFGQDWAAWNKWLAKDSNDDTRQQTP